MPDLLYQPLDYAAYLLACYGTDGSNRQLEELHVQTMWLDITPEEEAQLALYGSISFLFTAPPYTHLVYSQQGRAYCQVALPLPSYTLQIVKTVDEWYYVLNGNPILAFPRTYACDTFEGLLQLLNTLTQPHP